MTSKQEARKAEIDKLLEYLLTKLDADPSKWDSLYRLLNQYAYESGISARTLKEYAFILAAAGKIDVTTVAESPKVRRVAEAS